MKAVVKYGCNPKEVELRDVDTPQIGEDDVLIEVAACGVCGSDVEMWHHDVTFQVNVSPSDAARGSVGLASGMAIRCTAGTAM